MQVHSATENCSEREPGSDRSWRCQDCGLTAKAVHDPGNVAASPLEALRRREVDWSGIRSSVP